MTTLQQQAQAGTASQRRTQLGEQKQNAEVRMSAREQTPVKQLFGEVDMLRHALMLLCLLRSYALYAATRSWLLT